jgi:hypothetical protein
VRGRTRCVLLSGPLSVNIDTCACTHKQRICTSRGYVQNKVYTRVERNEEEV